MSGSLTLNSTAFAHTDPIPRRHTNDAENNSPPLSWEGVPEGTRSLALLVEDPDIPIPSFIVPAWTHWVVYNIPPDVIELPEAVHAGPKTPGGAKQGRNSYRKQCYSGPAPPFGTHRYYFRLYALDCTLELEPAKATKKKVLKAMEGHVLASAELMGTYQKQKKE